MYSAVTQNMRHFARNPMKGASQGIPAEITNGMATRQGVFYVHVRFCVEMPLSCGVPGW
jgi:hypothetical protein